MRTHLTANLCSAPFFFPKEARSRAAPQQKLPAAAPTGELMSPDSSRACSAQLITAANTAQLTHCHTPDTQGGRGFPLCHSLHTASASAYPIPDGPDAGK